MSVPEDIEAFFGYLVSDVFYALYVRDFLIGLDDEEMAEHAQSIMALCAELDAYVCSCREIMKEYDKFYSTFEPMGSSEIMDDSYLEIVRLIVDALGSATGGGRVGQDGRGLDAISDQVDEALNRLSEYGNFWFDGFESRVKETMAWLGAGRIDDARRAYRGLCRYMGDDLKERFEAIKAIESIADINRSTEDRLNDALGADRGYSFFETTRDDLQAKFEDVQYECLDVRGLLTPAQIEERVERLKKTVIDARVRSPSHPNLASRYFEKTGCFAIMMQDGFRKDLAAFSGNLDGSDEIAAYFCDSFEKRRVFAESIEDVINSEGFKSSFIHTPINETTSYYANVGDQTIVVSLKDVMEKSDLAGDSLCRMFSCCERKMLAWIKDNGVAGMGTLIVKLSTCKICFDAIEYFNKHEAFRCRMANPDYLVEWPVKKNEHYIEVALRVLNDADD